MKISLFAVMTLTLGTTAFAQGQQNKSAPQRIVIQKQAPLASKEGGSNVGGSEDYLQIRTSNQQLADLIDYERTAIEKFAQGNKSLSIDVLQEGLSNILESARTQADRETLTYRLAERAIQLSDQLKNEKNSYDANFNVLGFYYDLLTEKNAHYSNELFAWFEQNMVIRLQDGTIRPNYSDRIFAMTLSNLSRGLSQDLKAAGYANNKSLELLSQIPQVLDHALSTSSENSDLGQAIQTATQALAKAKAGL